MTLTLNTGHGPAYTLDKKSGEVTMPDGKTFNPSTNQNVDSLSLEELKVYNQERPQGYDAEAELERLAEEALEADIAAKDAVAKQASTKAAFKKALEDAGQLSPDTRAKGVVRTIIKRVRRFSKDLAEELLTPEEVAQYSSIDSAKVKANVAPSVYEMMQADQGFSLELKVDTGK
jgi:hypothetical protein